MEDRCCFITSSASLACDSCWHRGWFRCSSDNIGEKSWNLQPWFQHLAVTFWPLQSRSWRSGKNSWLILCSLWDGFSFRLFNSNAEGAFSAAIHWRFIAYKWPRKPLWSYCWMQTSFRVVRNVPRWKYLNKTNWTMKPKVDERILKTSNRLLWGTGFTDVREILVDQLSWSSSWVSQYRFLLLTNESKRHQPRDVLGE